VLASEAELASAASAVASASAASIGAGCGAGWGPICGGCGGKFVPASLPVVGSLPQATPRATWATVQVASAVRRSASFSPEGKGEGFFIE
jgi:hypothetical protein